MEESSQQRKKQFDYLKAYQWQKGQSGNPGGRPKKTLKDFARDYLAGMSDEDRIAYFESIDPEVVWKMAEGNPQSDDKLKVDIPTSLIEIISGITKPKSDSGVSKEDKE